ncbi:hypothetical protein IJ182_03895 [bacterium]|nr:hypothetical protein [bacterium]
MNNYLLLFIIFTYGVSAGFLVNTLRLICFAIILVFLADNINYIFWTVVAIIGIKLFFVFIRHKIEEKNFNLKDTEENTEIKKIINKCNPTYLGFETDKKVVLLAQNYITEFLKENNELDFNDYKKFNNIVQNENNIKIKNNYNTEVPYCLREILYTVYLDRKKDINY